MHSTHRRFGRDRESMKWDFAEHLKYTLSCDRYSATDKDRFMALAYTVRDRLIHQWIHTQQQHHDQQVKRIYYLSLEFLMGRAMTNNVTNLGLEGELREMLNELGYTYEELIGHEVDAGLGNGGLGRLAACFLDSMATLDLPAFGYGIRYNYGIFRQQITNGFQLEEPDDWLRFGNPWEVERRDIEFPVHFGGNVESTVSRGKRIYIWENTQTVNGHAYDTPIVGYGGKTVNTLRLWSARAAESFSFQDFSEGDYVEAVRNKVLAENLSQVLYPNDQLYQGKVLRLKQQYFFVACSLADIFRRFRKYEAPWEQFPDYVALQLNDTHPSLAIPELMRLLIDEEMLDWETAWDITQRSMGYTNHTLMPEALERWPVPMLEANLPRHLQIIYEINHRFLQRAITFFPGQMDKIRKVSIVEEGDTKQIRMANMSIIGSRSTNGVAELHTNLLKSRMFPEFSKMFPERFNSKTNGITQRRWLLSANPPLANLITETIGDSWITDFSQIRNLRPYAEDAAFLQSYGKVKAEAKRQFSSWLHSEFGWRVDPESIFDTQVKRIHEYKRQMLNALHIIILYNRMRDGKPQDFAPVSFFFGGKAAPGYTIAKLMIKFIGNLSEVINHDPILQGRLKVFFLPNYRVSLAERIIPATDLSEQISTAGKEASGTGNMKFMCNGALTIGTMDGANIEIVEEAGRENAFIFGHDAEEIQQLSHTYDPHAYCTADEEIQRAVDLMLTGHFNFSEPGLFEPLRKALFDDGDQYLHFADLSDYKRAHGQARELYWKDQEEWKRRAVINIASSSKFSSDRTISQYAEEIWGVKPCPTEVANNAEAALEDAAAVNGQRH